MDCSRFGNKLNYYREKNDMTDKDLAKKLHVSVRTIEKIENGEITPNDRLVAKASELFGVDFWDYLNLDERHRDSHYVDTDDPEYKPVKTLGQPTAKSKPKTQMRKPRTRTSSGGGIRKVVSMLLFILALVIVIAGDNIMEMLGLEDMGLLTLPLVPFILIIASIIGKTPKR